MENEKDIETPTEQSAERLSRPKRRSAAAPNSYALLLKKGLCIESGSPSKASQSLSKFLSKSTGAAELSDDPTELRVKSSPSRKRKTKTEQSGIGVVLSGDAETINEGISLSDDKTAIAFEEGDQPNGATDDLNLITDTKSIAKMVEIAAVKEKSEHIDNMKGSSMNESDEDQSEGNLVIDESKQSKNKRTVSSKKPKGRKTGKNKDAATEENLKTKSAPETNAPASQFKIDVRKKIPFLDDASDDEDFAGFDRDEAAARDVPASLLNPLLAPPSKRRKTHDDLPDNIDLSAPRGKRRSAAATKSYATMLRHGFVIDDMYHSKFLEPKQHSPSTLGSAADGSAESGSPKNTNHSSSQPTPAGKSAGGGMDERLLMKSIPELQAMNVYPRQPVENYPWYVAQPGEPVLEWLTRVRRMLGDQHFVTETELQLQAAGISAEKFNSATLPKQTTTSVTVGAETPTESKVIKEQDDVKPWSKKPFDSTKKHVLSKKTPGTLGAPPTPLNQRPTLKATPNSRLSSSKKLAAKTDKESIESPKVASSLKKESTPGSSGKQNRIEKKASTVPEISQGSQFDTQYSGKQFLNMYSQLLSKQGNVFDRAELTKIMKHGKPKPKSPLELPRIRPLMAAYATAAVKFDETVLKILEDAQREMKLKNISTLESMSKGISACSGCKSTDVELQPCKKFQTIMMCDRCCNAYEEWQKQPEHFANTKKCSNGGICIDLSANGCDACWFWNCVNVAEGKLKNSSKESSSGSSTPVAGSSGRNSEEREIDSKTISSSNSSGDSNDRSLGTNEKSQTSGSPQIGGASSGPRVKNVCRRDQFSGYPPATFPAKNKKREIEIFGASNSNDQISLSALPTKEKDEIVKQMNEDNDLADETPAVSAKNGKAKGGGKNGKTGKGQPSLEKRMAAFSKLVRPNSIEAPGSSFEKQLAAADPLQVTQIRKSAPGSRKSSHGSTDSIPLNTPLGAPLSTRLSSRHSSDSVGMDFEETDVISKGKKAKCEKIERKISTKPKKNRQMNGKIYDDEKIEKKHPVDV